MKKYTAIFSTAFIALILFGSGCDTAERNTATGPAMTASPTVTPMTPEISPAPAVSPGATAAPAWLAEGATHRVADITGAPNAMIGKTVTVVADIDEVYGPRAFKLNGLNGLDGLDGNSSLAGGVNKDLLALIPKVGSFPNLDDQWKNSKARVTGVVQHMTPKNVEREIGWELSSKLEAKFKGKPVLIVRSVERFNR